MKNIINGYLKIIKLKEILRTGWVEVGVSKEKVESLMDHIGGTIIFAMLINDAKNLSLLKRCLINSHTGLFDALNILIMFIIEYLNIIKIIYKVIYL